MFSQIACFPKSPAYNIQHWKWGPGVGNESHALSNKVSCFVNQGLYYCQQVLSSFRGIYWNVYQYVCVCSFVFLGLISVKYPLQDAIPLDAAVVCLPI